MSSPANFVPDASICPEDLRLLEEFAATTEAYFDAVKKLKHVKGEVEFFKAYEFAELTRKDCFALREAVERHREQHGCRKVSSLRRGV